MKKKKGKERLLRRFGSGAGQPHQVWIGDLGLATTLIRVRHTVSVQTRIAGEIKPVTEANSIWNNLEELDSDNSALNLPVAKTTAFFGQSSRSQPQEQISGRSQLHHNILDGNWRRANTPRLRRGCSLISGRLCQDPLSGLSQLHQEVLGGHYRRARSFQWGANRGTSITKWFLHLSRLTPGCGMCVRPCRGCLVPVNPLYRWLANDS